MRQAPLCIAVALIPFIAGLAHAEIRLESAVYTSSYDEIYEPYDFDVDESEDYTDVEGGSVFVISTTCLSPCVVIPPIQGEGQAGAETHYGDNHVDVYSQSYDITDNHTYEDSAAALSQWRDELTFTTAAPDLIGTVRARFRVAGSWDNNGGFAFVGYFYDPATELENCGDAGPPCYGVVAWNSVHNGASGEPSSPSVVPDVPFNFFMTSLPPTPFPDFGQEDGDVDTTIDVEFPLLLDRPIRFGGMLLAWANLTPYAQVNSLDATVEWLSVPAGVDVDSAANELASYHLPEPDAALGCLVALLALARLRQRIYL